MSARAARKGYSLLECLMVLGAMTGLVAMAASTAAWSVRESRETTIRIAGAEALSNILEEARAEGFDGVDKAWAGSRSLPESIKRMAPGSALEVTVTLVPGAPGVKLVAASLELRSANHPQPRTIRMSTIVGPRPGTGT